METVIPLVPDKVNSCAPQNAPQLPPHTFPNTLMTNPRELNPPMPNPMRGSHDPKNPRPNIPHTDTKRTSDRETPYPPDREYTTSVLSYPTYVINL